MRPWIAIAMAAGIVCVAAIVPSRAEENVDETIGEKINRGVNRIGEELRQGWAEVRKSIDKLSVEGRVYGRLHWDKELTDTTIDIQVRDDHVVVLKGSVDNQSAKSKAMRLAQDTVGVKQVVDELAVSSE